MSSLRAALVAAILEAPDDDTPRLIAADWFEEQGGEANAARAEFIRTQIQRSRLPPEDIRQSMLQARELRLLKRWAPVWCSSHFVFKKVRFRRGFIEYVHLHLQHFLHHRRQMFALEPVRDVSLTGWYRAPDDLVRRVAGCEEWKNIDTLRIHHQGPHHDPRSNLVELLESPHLTCLRALHCPLVQFDAEARQRFERLTILRHVKELSFPTLDTLMMQPGGWFSDSGAKSAQEWKELKSLSLPYFLDRVLLERLTEMPFWNHLEVIKLNIPWAQDAPWILAILGGRMPAMLRELHINGRYEPNNNVGQDGFFERLAETPLQNIHFASLGISSPLLEQLLSHNKWQLQELSLEHCGITDRHAGVLAESPAVGRLWSLNLSSNREFNASAAKRLFASERFHSITRLDLSTTQLGKEGAAALAAAKGWDRLRALNLSAANLGEGDLRKLLVSPNLQHLTWCKISGGGYHPRVSLDLTPQLANELIRLPNLVNLRLDVNNTDPRSKRILMENDSLAWVSIYCDDEEGMNIQRHRAYYAPARWPPVDDA